MNKFVAFSLSFQTHKNTSNFCQMRPRTGCNCAHEIVTKYAWFPIRKYRPLYKSINAQDMIVYYPIIIEFIWLLLQCIARQKYAIQGQISPTICSRVRMNVVSVCASVLPVDFLSIFASRLKCTHTQTHAHTYANDRKRFAASDVYTVPHAGYMVCQCTAHTKHAHMYARAWP